MASPPPRSSGRPGTRPIATADLLRRIRAEYREMPGLTLTVPQAQRLWSLDANTCHAALDALVEAHFLIRSPRGTFVMAPATAATAPAHAPDEPGTPGVAPGTHPVGRHQRLDRRSA
jgi:hypothetical protein